MNYVYPWKLEWREDRGDREGEIGALEFESQLTLGIISVDNEEMRKKIK